MNIGVREEAGVRRLRANDALSRNALRAEGCGDVAVAVTVAGSARVRVAIARGIARRSGAADGGDVERLALGRGHRLSQLEPSQSREVVRIGGRVDGAGCVGRVGGGRSGGGRIAYGLFTRRGELQLARAGGVRIATIYISKGIGARGTRIGALGCIFLTNIYRGFRIAVGYGFIRRLRFVRGAVVVAIVFAFLDRGFGRAVGVAGLIAFGRAVAVCVAFAFAVRVLRGIRLDIGRNVVHAQFQLAVGGHFAFEFGGVARAVVEVGLEREALELQLRNIVGHKVRAHLRLKRVNLPQLDGAVGCHGVVTHRVIRQGRRVGFDTIAGRCAENVCGRFRTRVGTSAGRIAFAVFGALAGVAGFVCGASAGRIAADVSVAVVGIIHCTIFGGVLRSILRRIFGPVFFAAVGEFRTAVSAVCPSEFRGCSFGRVFLDRVGRTHGQTGRQNESQDRCEKQHSARRETHVLRAPVALRESRVGNYPRRLVFGFADCHVGTLAHVHLLAMQLLRPRLVSIRDSRSSGTRTTPDSGHPFAPGFTCGLRPYWDAFRTRSQTQQASRKRRSLPSVTERISNVQIRLPHSPSQALSAWLPRVYQTHFCSAQDIMQFAAGYSSPYARSHGDLQGSFAHQEGQISCSEHVFTLSKRPLRAQGL